MNRTQRISFLASVAGIAACLLLWLWQLEQEFPAWASLAILIGGILLIFPVCWAGRRLLDERPTEFRANWVNLGVHLALILLFGTAIVEAVKVGREWRGWEIPLPEPVGQALFAVTSLAALATVINLALRGLGAPFALALTRRLAMDWMYAWTRNPMGLTSLAALAALALWYRSLYMLLWALLLVTPAWLFFAKYYEERELEIRFGKPYLAYKARTPFMLPRKPRPEKLPAAKGKTAPSNKGAKGSKSAKPAKGAKPGKPAKGAKRAHSRH